MARRKKEITEEKPKITWRYVKKSFRRNWDMYLLLLLPLAFFIIFKYKPMTSLIIAFKRYNMKLGYFASPWAKDFGFQYFLKFFKSTFFTETVWNTVSLSVLQLVISFPIPIILAIITNEVRSKHLKKTMQLVTYTPHFISTVILIAMITTMFRYGDDYNTGIINQIIKAFGGERVYFLQTPKFFKHLYIGSGIWQNAGYNAIIYIAALANIDTQQIEAARIDGASRWQIIWHITIPGILPTAIILLIMSCGKIMNVGFEKVFLLKESLAAPRGVDVIQTYVYSMGIKENQYSYATAIGLFESVINVILLLTVNKISKKVTETSLW